MNMISTNSVRPDSVLFKKIEIEILLSNWFWKMVFTTNGGLLLSPLRFALGRRILGFIPIVAITKRNVEVFPLKMKTPASSTTFNKLRVSWMSTDLSNWAVQAAREPIQSFAYTNKTVGAIFEQYYLQKWIQKGKRSFRPFWIRIHEETYSQHFWKRWWY